MGLVLCLASSFYITPRGDYVSATQHCIPEHPSLQNATSMKAQNCEPEVPRPRTISPPRTLLRGKQKNQYPRDPKTGSKPQPNLPSSGEQAPTPLSFLLKLRTAMINGETGSHSMDVKVPLDKGVRSEGQCPCGPSRQH